MIYTLTMNPAVDYVVHVDRLMRGETNRSQGEEFQLGGKGINVSLVLKNLGMETVALGFIAGFTGDALEREMASCGLKTDFIRLADGFTRINLKLKSGDETEINAKGPAITEADMEKLYEKLGHIRSGDTLVLAGSVPGTLSQDTYADICRRLSDRGIRFVVDATGELLLRTLEYRPFLVKPNRTELEEISGRMLPTDGAIAEAAQELKRQGAVNVLVSLGGDGALLLDEFGKVHRTEAHRGRVISTTGAGDSMVAGFLAGVSQGYEYALALGSAAGSATSFASGFADKESILALCP